MTCNNICCVLSFYTVCFVVLGKVECEQFIAVQFKFILYLYFIVHLVPPNEPFGETVCSGF